ncbi:MAG: HAMP domain-containing sensor histidine kinase [Dissulfuribacterales bacterium]
MKIRNKITLWITCTGLLFGLIFSSIVIWEMREQSINIVDKQLHTTALIINNELSKYSENNDIKLDETLNNITDKYWLKIYDSNKNIIYESKTANSINIPLKENKNKYTVNIKNTSVSKLKNEDIDEVIPFRVLTLNNKDKIIQIAQSIIEIDEEISNLLAAIGTGLGISSIFLIVLSYILANKIIQPIANINKLTHEITAATLNKRIVLPKNKDEIYELSKYLNEMFDRLQFAFQRQQRLIADTSHELKTPLTILRIFFEELSENKEVSTELKEKIQKQWKNIIRLNKLIKNLLELSALEAQISSEMKLLNLSELIQNIIDDLIPMIEEEHITIEYDMSKSIMLQGNKEQLRRLFINLIDNAIKYNINNGKIIITAFEFKNNVHVSIQNTGKEIPQDEIAKIFDQFYRVEKSRSTKYGGAGLGLTIAREIVRLHNGRISIQSKDGFTTVNLELPVNDSHKA